MVARLHPLDRKLVRDLWRLRGQALAIALIIASGVAVLGGIWSAPDPAEAVLGYIQALNA